MSPEVSHLPPSLSKPDVGNAADAYVLLLAHRYGFRPKDGNPDRKSITQLEYEEAGRHSGKARLVFIVDPEHPWKRKWIDKGQDERDPDAFKATVLERHGISHFTDPDQLLGVVLQAHEKKTIAVSAGPDVLPSWIGIAQPLKSAAGPGGSSVRAAPISRFTWRGISVHISARRSARLPSLSCCRLPLAGRSARLAEITHCWGIETVWR